MKLLDFLRLVNPETKVKIETPTRYVLSDPTYARDAINEHNVKDIYCNHEVIEIADRVDYYDGAYIFIMIEEHSEEQRINYWWNS